MRGFSFGASACLIVGACNNEGSATNASETASGTGTATLTGTGTVDPPTTSGSESATEVVGSGSATGTVSGTDSTGITSPLEPTTMDTVGMTGMTSTTGMTTMGDPSETTTAADGSATDTSGSSGAIPCVDGQIVCEGNVAKTCDGMGGFKSEEVCDGVCMPDLGCSLCVPDATTCEGQQVFKCNAMGNGNEPLEACDPLLGLSCDAEVGACVGACAGLGLSYIGCEYYPTVLQQFEGYGKLPREYAVAIANTSAEVAKVTVTQGPNTITQVDVAADSVQLVVLPWVNALAQGFDGSNIVIDGAYHLRSSRPITVYQYNPLTVGVSNDASLLLPVNTWTGNYLVASWPTFPFGNNEFMPGLYAVVAQEDGTIVTLKPSTTGKLVKAGGGVAVDGTGVVMLDDGDVLQVFSDVNGDVTGSIVEADKPVQVFGGHKCTNVPLNVTAADHLEESMFPIETLAKEYVVVPPVQVPNNNFQKGQVVRVIASEDDTTLVFTPDQPVAKLLAKAGDFVQIPTSTSKFVVTGDKKILVAQYMVGQEGGYGSSDPAMLVAVNPQQWRKSYLFHAPTLWKANFVDIIAPKDATVTVDDVPVAGWQPIGATKYQVAHVTLASVNNGNHSVVGNVGVGIGVYGVQDYGSYWYPGGLDLDVIPQ